MAQELLIRLNWEGSETIEAIRPVLRKPCRIELTLAAKQHLPAEIDGAVARRTLAAVGLTIDSLTSEQQNYLGSRREGA